jgi:phosphomannomutase
MTAVSAPPPTFYVCPGERQAITRSVHWGRLAAFYEKCGACPHRHDTGLLPRGLIADGDRTPRPAGSSVVIAADGIRGRYLNDLDRQRAFAWASAFAAWLWDQRPLTGRIDDESTLRRGSPTTSPIVVVGYDERPSSPDVAMGVVTALRQMGCRTIDVGCLFQPVWRYAAETLGADGGVFVTGAGCDPVWTGLDFLGSCGAPMDGLESIAAQVDSLPHRPTRAAGTVESRAVLDDYAAGLDGWFHALRPLRVACATPLAGLRDMLPRWFESLPCRLSVSTWPRQRQTDAEMPPGGERIAATVRESAADVGLLIDEDGAARAVFDERGGVIPRALWRRWLTHCAPSCDLRDGVITLGALLQALSTSDAPLSERVAA